jgi:hypothetical protein
MSNYNELSKKPSQFLSLTGYTVEEFLALLPHFRLRLQNYLTNFTFEGKKRQNRKYVEYRNAGLATMENKLLFILIYLKGNDLQESLAERFRMSQPKANRWIHLLHEVLNQSLNDIEMLPARDANSLESKLAILTEETTTDDATINTNIPVETTTEIEADLIEID